jgi:tRNA1Val (adenine37-N6)-methyltransferase
MSKSVFRFKKFVIDQSNCGMKITADACLFAALVKPSDTQNILDIGAGTGVLSLMLAQVSDADIVALEIEESAYYQCQVNFFSSPWKDRLKVHKGDYRLFECERQFDLIISNPPFFKNQKPSKQFKRKLAFHQDYFEIGEFFRFANNNLTPKGNIYLLYPSDQVVVAQNAAKELGLHLAEIIRFKGKLNKISHCSSLKFGRAEKDTIVSHFICRNEDNSYTSAYEKELKSYYTIF